MRRLAPAFLLLLAACGPQAQAPASPASAAPDLDPTVLASLPAPYNAADLTNGKRQFGLCRSCHTTVAEGSSMTGPNLHELFGRQAGSKEGYKYTAALTGAGFAWDAQHLDAWIKNPREYLPGTKMTFPGLKSDKDRVDLIGYLKVATTSAAKGP